MYFTKLKLCRNVHNISLYRSCVFIVVAHVLTNSSHCLTCKMGKVKTGLYYYLTADILTKVLQKCSFSSPLTCISFFSNPLSLIGCHGDQKAKLANNIKKSSISSEAIRGIKLKLCRTVHNISLYNCVILLPLLMYFCCYDNLKCPLAYNGKSENWHLLLFHCKYFVFRNVY